MSDEWWKLSDETKKKNPNRQFHFAATKLMFQFFSLFIIIYDLIIEKGEYQPWMFQLET